MRQHGRTEETRRRVLDAARRLLVERGYHGVGLEEVARAAGVSRQAVYLHFGSKPELLVAMARRVDELTRTAEALQPALEAKTALEALDLAIAAYATIEPQIYDIASVLHASRRSDPAAEAAWQDRMAFRRDFFRQVVLGLEGEGLLAKEWNVEEATDFVWGLLSPHTYEYLVLERGWPIERFVGHLREVLRRALVRGRRAAGPAGKGVTRSAVAIPLRGTTPAKGD